MPRFLHGALLFSALLGVAPAFAAPLSVETVAGDPAQKATVWVENSLTRIFPKSPAGSEITHKATAARNQKLSFQIALKNESISPINANCLATTGTPLNVQVRRVGYVPMHHLTLEVPRDEIDGSEYLPGLVPDPLLPDTNTVVGPLENLAWWVTVRVPENAPTGPHKLDFNLNLGSAVTSVSATIDVTSFTIQKRKNFPVTHWWRPNSIYRFHNHQPWSDDWFTITEKYIRNMVDHGSNMVLVPSFEVRRELFTSPTQMLLISRQGDKYTFDYKHVRRFVHMAKAAGIEHFEWPHLWIYWGVKNPMVVYEEKGGKMVPMWPQDADGFSDMYRNFLKQYLDSLHTFLQEEKLLEISYFHISDEPHGDEHFARYQKARALAKELAPWMKTMDALSEVRYGKMGATDFPVPTTAAAEQYISEGLPHWVYYCTVPRGRYINRFMDTPMNKVRIQGALFYKLKALGFLHWGYNYYDQIEVDKMLDPFARGDSGAWPGIPYGDPFVVYPGADGPIDSARWEIFGESLQDYAILQTAGISPDDPGLKEMTTYAEFPRDPAYLQNIIDKIIKGQKP